MDMSYKLFSALFIKSRHILLNIRQHTSHYEVLTRCEPPQSNVQSNIWMRRSYEHTDPYQSSTNVKDLQTIALGKRDFIKTLDGAVAKLLYNNEKIIKFAINCVFFSWLLNYK